jgi:hypothetical protein
MTLASCMRATLYPRIPTKDQSLIDNHRSEEKRDTTEKRNVDIESYPCMYSGTPFVQFDAYSNTYCR